MPMFVPDAVLKGVWGPESKINSLFNGGIECAAQSSVEYKAMVNLILVSSLSFNTVNSCHSTFMEHENTIDMLKKAIESVTINCSNKEK
jgi:hypothetical protein